MSFKIFAFLAVLTGVQCYEILGLFPHFGKSHHDVFEPLLLLLAERGHRLTVVSHFEPKTTPEGWRHISMGDFQEQYRETIDLSFFESSSIFERFSHIQDFFLIAGFGLHMCEAMTSLEPIHRMIEDKTKFDLILTEQFVSDCSLGIAHLLNAPVIQLQSHVMMPWTFERFNQPSDPAYIPNLYSGHPSKMNFLERLENAVFHTLYKFLHKYYVLTADKEILERNLNRTIPPLDEIAKNTSALLSNTHYMLNGVKPLMPTVVEVAGMHIKRTMNPLNSELEKFMNESTDGVILFSMGSMIKATSIPEPKLKYFFEIFGRLKQNVIWKWEGDRVPGQPDNVFTMKWVPQFELLHHPKTVAFISHGGLLGTLECLHAGKPALFIPVFGDQYTNAAANEENGLGIRIPYSALTKQNFEAAVDKILTTEMRTSAQKLSEAWRDNPDPLILAADTVEHILHHGGHRRRGKFEHLSFAQSVLLDVVLFITTIISLLAYIAYKLIKTVIKLAARSKKLKQS